MARARNAEAAARKILALMAKHSPKTVEQVVAEHPELSVGRELAKKSLESTNGSDSTQPTVRTRGSGPAVLNR